MKKNLNGNDGIGIHPGRAKYTSAGHALDKHGNRNPTVYLKAIGNEIQKNKQGQTVLEDILYPEILRLNFILTGWKSG